MIDGHFDHLARLAATLPTRRHLLRGFVAALVAAPLGRSPATATRLQGTVAVGGSCRSNAECRQSDMQSGAVCGDNGFTSDGQLTCCLSQGSGQACCESDADCCGDERCAPSGDVCAVCRRPPFPTRGLGQLCAGPADCVPSVTCTVACLGGRCGCNGQGVPANTGMPDIPDADAALAAAEELSLLEATGQFDTLYDRMHPDAKRVVPRQAVVGWYRDQFAPLGPTAADARKVRFVPWTWGVTGQTFSGTAEVAYVQGFANGAVERDEVRLVRDAAGNWGWFFGRDLAFVQAQIARYGGQ